MILTCEREIELWDRTAVACMAQLVHVTATVPHEHVERVLANAGLMADAVVALSRERKLELDNGVSYG